MHFAQISLAPQVICTALIDFPFLVRVLVCVSHRCTARAIIFTLMKGRSTAVLLPTDPTDVQDGWQLHSQRHNIAQPRPMQCPSKCNIL